MSMCESPLTLAQWEKVAKQDLPSLQIRFFIVERVYGQENDWWAWMNAKPTYDHGRYHLPVGGAMIKPNAFRNGFDIYMNE